MIKYAVSIPSHDSLYTMIAFLFREPGGDVVYVVNHDLFMSLLDESRLYMVVPDDATWGEKIIPSVQPSTVYELRKIRDAQITRLNIQRK